MPTPIVSYSWNPFRRRAYIQYGAIQIMVPAVGQVMLVMPAGKELLWSVYFDSYFIQPAKFKEVVRIVEHKLLVRDPLLLQELKSGLHNIYKPAEARGFYSVYAF